MTSNQLIGIGLREPHLEEVLETSPHIGWFEVHSENFFYPAGTALDQLIQIRDKYPISLHGVGLSLGSSEGIDEAHLEKIGELEAKIDPFLVSEHLSWGRVGGINMHDLLPVPYTREVLEIFKHNINKTQEFLGREILIENASSYIEYKSSEFGEVEFLAELCRQTGAKILLDVNNIFVSCSNHGWNPIEYINKIPKDLVKEIHLAGHTTKTIGGGEILRVDSHDSDVSGEVWNLYEIALKRFDRLPTLLEWDSNIPELDYLVRAARKAEKYLENKSNDYVRA
jgi:uncharacterized protein (UPF0276 family)